MEDVLVVAQATFKSEDLQSWRSIIKHANALEHFCKEYARIEEETVRAADALTTSIYGQEPVWHRHRRERSREQHFNDIWRDIVRGLLDGFGDPILKDSMLGLEEIRPTCTIQLVSEEPRIAGEREMTLAYVDTLKAKAILWGTDGEEDEHGLYPLHFAVLADVRQPEQQEVSVAIDDESQEDLYVCGVLHNELRPEQDDRERADA